MEKIFEESINCNYKRILTLQDDVIFDNNFNSILEEYINNTPNDWKILSFGVSQHMWSKVNILKGKYYYNTPYYTDGAFAIGFDSSIYKYIINEIKKFNCNFDSGPIRSIYKKYPNKCYTLYPNIIIADLKNSNTQKDRDMKQYAKIFKWKLENFIF
jgi:GR25 family glycosyltransferase involved in LPS biosynthesis